MTRRVNNIIAKRSGLQQRYFCSYSHGSNQSSNPHAANFEYGFYSANDFVNNWNMVTAGSAEKVNIRTIYTKVWISNGTNVPIYLWYWWLTPRRDTGVLAYNSMLTDYPGAMDEYTDPTLSTTFRREYKIIKRGCRMLGVQGTTLFKHSKFWRGGRPISGAIEGAVTYTRKLSRILFIKACTTPQDTNAGAATLAECTFNGVTRTGCSYYLQEDNDPSINGPPSLGYGPAKTFTDVTEQSTAVLSS